MRRLARRPSPAMVVSILALIVALSGTSFASETVGQISALINGKRIKKGSIPGRALKKNTLTGVQINESKLGKVPKAANADNAANAASAANAANAANAAALGGVGAGAFQTFGDRAIPSGTTVTGPLGIAVSAGGASSMDIKEAISLGGIAPVALTDATVNFASAAGVTDADPACTGSASNPTAPAGKVCLYFGLGQGLGSTFEGLAIPGTDGRRGFMVHINNPSVSGGGIFGSWAYTAP